ncbi:ABC transporter ATP-binding protein [Alicyclobacillus tolerans]|uniref:ABC transporter ATP-binding protein n=1 Tax=Alicyclobacillus tolerans TaxID=90970 RepID=UPI001F4507B7|nr:ABC transporter ATP-binding protein [Alicyclobacillus tolerans]MCF8564111.1 ABC transporter ATP-binding protein [Alicyclobacillus tolerans]
MHERQTIERQTSQHQADGPQPVLSVTGLQKQIKDRLIVKDVSFEVGPGQIFGFLGPNGAGKTTTIRMLVGLIRPTAGQITIDGHDLSKEPLSAMRRVGCIVENPDLYPYLTGYENLFQLARMQGAEAVARIDEVAGLVRLSDVLKDKVKTYSLGMRQRLGIAQALLGNPKLLILDEPTNGLDPAGIRELRSFLRQLSQQGMTIFVSSHLLAEVELLCDHIAIIRDGTVVRTGAIESLLAQASNEVFWHVDPPQLALEVLRRHAQSGMVREVEVLPPGKTLGCSMSDSQIADATAEMVHYGVRIYAITRHKATLEDVFLQTTGGDSTHGVLAPGLE